MTADLPLFRASLKTGYKQAIMGRLVKSMWTSFVIMGPGVKAGHEIPTPIDMMDQYPTIMTLLGQRIPDFVEGRVCKEILKRGV